MLTCLAAWRRVVCYLDNINHYLPKRIQFRSLCDLHDRMLVAQYREQEMAPLQEWRETYAARPTPEEVRSARERYISGSGGE